MATLNDTKVVSKSLDLPCQTIYDYDNHRNIPWNIVEYEPTRQYLDHAKIAEGRKFRNRKGAEKDLKYVTKRGFYMDYHLKVVGALPAPSIYTLKDGMDQTKNKKKSPKYKIDTSLKKNTYHDWIQTEAKSRKIPGVAAYSLNPTQKQIKDHWRKLSSRKRKIGPKRHFYQDIEYLSNTIPGPGINNPHQASSYVKLNKTNPKQMIEKHLKEQKVYLKKRKLEPAPGSYRPISISERTFEKTARQTSEKKRPISANGFGSNARFSYQKPSKIKIKEKRPEPGTYPNWILWKGKKDDQPRTKGWIRSLSTGFTKGVYN